MSDYNKRTFSEVTWFPAGSSQWKLISWNAHCYTEGCLKYKKVYTKGIAALGNGALYVHSINL